MATGLGLTEKDAAGEDGPYVGNERSTEDMDLEDEEGRKGAEAAAPEARVMERDAGPSHSSTPKLRSSSSLRELAHYVPMRLTESERSLLTVLESALHVSEYTDNVDVVIRGSLSKVQRMLDGIQEACNISTGLAVCGMQDDAAKLRAMEEDMIRDGSSLNGQDLRISDDSLTGKAKGALLSRVPNIGKGRNGKKQKKGKSHKGKKSSKLKNALKSKRRNRADVPLEDADEDFTGNLAAGTARKTASRSNGASLASRKTEENAVFFQTLFEIGRRNKVLNPAKMRATYGKLMHLLQDAQNPTVAKSLGFSLHKDLLMVGPYLERRGCVKLLDDPRLEIATAHIPVRNDATGVRYERAAVELHIQNKKKVTGELVQEYGLADPDETEKTDDEVHEGNKHRPKDNKKLLTKEEVRRCIDSISDAISVVESNLAPVRRVLRMLEDNFDPGRPESKFSLELRGSGFSTSSRYYGGSSNNYGRFGFSAFGSLGGNSEAPTLSHSHSTQFTFVQQSLLLWCEVQKNMHRLWVCADDDLLSTSARYHLLNTGQGLNRVQSCPRVAKVMRGLLGKAQKAAGAPWVGLSVIHLGDRDVPNALVFIDKYTQIPRFLKPIVDFVDGLPELCRDERIEAYVQNNFGSLRTLKMTVLADYFKHGFDGSGDDGGSCIDGRLTSSWNWTSRIAKKSYYHAFMMAGFQGFDGEFR